MNRPQRLPASPTQQSHDELQPQRRKGVHAEPSAGLHPRYAWRGAAVTPAPAQWPFAAPCAGVSAFWHSLQYYFNVDNAYVVSKARVRPCVGCQRLAFARRRTGRPAPPPAAARPLHKHRLGPLPRGRGRGRRLLRIRAWCGGGGPRWFQHSPLIRPPDGFRVEQRVGRGWACSRARSRGATASTRSGRRCVAPTTARAQRRALALLTPTVSACTRRAGGVRAPHLRRERAGPVPAPHVPHHLRPLRGPAGGHEAEVRLLPPLPLAAPARAAPNGRAWRRRRQVYARGAARRVHNVPGDASDRGTTRQGGPLCHALHPDPLPRPHRLHRVQVLRVRRAAVPARPRPVALTAPSPGPSLCINTLVGLLLGSYAYYAAFAATATGIFVFMVGAPPTRARPRPDARRPAAQVRTLNAALMGSDAGGFGGSFDQPTMRRLYLKFGYVSRPPRRSLARR